jgi:outer membrane protein OmpA-like peptidoglycan-associated protein
MCRRLTVLALVAGVSGMAAWPASAQRPNIADPIPPGARGAVLPITGEVRAIQGLSSGFAGQSEALAAALTSLGATTTPTTITIELSADVLFDFDKASIKPDAEPSLQKLLTILSSYPHARVVIEGYTDAKGSDSYNLGLSQRRADAVRAWLSARPAARGIEFTAHGLGSTNPVAPNRKPDGSDDPAGRQKNRRVTIRVSKE